MQEIQILINDEHSHLRLDQLLAGEIDFLSRSQAQTLIREGAVLADNTPITSPKKKLNVGQLLLIKIPTPKAIEPEPQAVDFSILWEDEHLLVINKPAGLTVHPGAGNPDGTLLNGLLHHNDALKHLPRAGIVHRLDKDTSGVMMIAQSNLAYLALIDMMKERHIKRTYHALCWGHPPVQFSVDAPIGRHSTKRTRMSVTSQGKHALTHFNTLAEYGPLTLLECQLETGRTHQIRVHLHHQGYPIVADPVYQKKIQLPSKIHSSTQLLINQLDRQFLHAVSLKFNHPISGEPLDFQAPYPHSLNAIMTHLGETYAD